MKVPALERGRRLHREQAMELLWPELDAVAAQNNLHQVVHAARGVLGPDRLTLDDGMLALAGDVATDVDAFEAAAADARAGNKPSAYAAALHRFGGELLPEDRYEPWGLAHERAGNAERAAELVVAGAEVWERHLEGHVPRLGALCRRRLLARRRSRTRRTRHARPRGACAAGIRRDACCRALPPASRR